MAKYDDEGIRKEVTSFLSIVMLKFISNPFPAIEKISDVVSKTTVDMYESEGEEGIQPDTLDGMYYFE